MWAFHNSFFKQNPIVFFMEYARVILKAGTRIRFLKTLIEPADGDHPEFLMAKEGDLGRIVKKRSANSHWDYSVTWDGFQKPFCADRSEFEAVQ